MALIAPLQERRIRKKISGGMSIDGFSSYVEEKFEQVKLDSRPREGVKIPEPGALIVDRTVALKKPMVKDKDSAAEN